MLPFTQKRRILVEALLPGFEQHQFHIDHAVEVVAPHLDALLFRAEQSGYIRIEPKQVFDRNLHGIDPGYHIVVRWVATAEQQQKKRD